MINPSHERVAPVKPAVAYIGGKRNLSKDLVQLIQSTPHHVYAEAFVGMGGVFFRRTVVPKSEVINDASRDVATFFRILQEHYPQFMDVLKFQLTTRADFERLNQVDPDTLTDLNRAARFLYLQAISYGGKVAGRTFGVDPSRSGRFNVTILAQRLAEIAERMSSVVIECLDFEPFIRRYDSKGTLFFADSPYVGTEDYYDASLFQEESLWRLAATLKAIKGRFIATNLDHPKVRDAFKGCEIREVEVTYTAAGRGNSKQVGELIIIGGQGH
jgi:DNA adenine methylase